MEGVNIQDLTSGYKERIRRLALFDPLYELDRKREHDLNGVPLDLKGLGLLTLLFFFEKKLMRETKTGVKQLALFLKEMTEKSYVLPEEKYTDLARTVIHIFRPTHGKKRDYPFFDWETRCDNEIEYSILKANNFDTKTNTQFYTLDEDGLELLFATKEFYSEFQLSINQLILRKQLDKGEFRAALRQINEMHIDVETLLERIVKLKHEIQRSIVSEGTFERYKQLVDDIYGRLEREDDEFKELRQFVKETRERLYSKDIHLKEQKTYRYILKITRELEAVHYEHSRLLDEALLLKNTTLITAQESLYYTGLHSFNFDQDIVSRIVSAPLPIEAMNGILHPFLKVEETELWSPLTVLAEQNITEEREAKDTHQFLEVGKNHEDHQYREWLTQRYREIMALFLRASEKGRGDTLSIFVAYLEENGLGDMLAKRYFYDFWIILHQRSPVTNGRVEEQESISLLSEALSLIKNRTMIITERQNIIKKVDRYSIQDLTIQWEDY
ncbi:hypothetical protein JOC78_003381 [Bacillus ectoiniformans]|uniref:replicative DNA helicase n=1 Tax=Bacillus ectoiniformans TaxID=1494429 RepID=UPI001959F099|nr:replicative DNA helicase [Bacillus ectoiniformans]MBM7650391.1 hypothetical protein [Bacillus ectoiniformans]